MSHRPKQATWSSPESMWEGTMQGGIYKETYFLGDHYSTNPPHKPQINDLNVYRDLLILLLFSASPLHSFRYTPLPRVVTTATRSSRNPFLSFPLGCWEAHWLAWHGLMPVLRLSNRDTIIASFHYNYMFGWGCRRNSFGATILKMRWCPWDNKDILARQDQQMELGTIWTGNLTRLYFWRFLFC